MIKVYFDEENRIKKIKLLLFILLFMTFSYFYQGGDHNSNTRMNLTRAIVEQGRFQTDSFSTNTADLALFKGHTYCDKAPGTSFLGVIPFFFMTHTEKLFPTKWMSKWGDLLRNHFTIATTVSLISSIAALFLFDLLGFYSLNILERLFVVLGYSLGTPVFTYSSLFYGHQIAGSIFIFLLYMFHKIILGEIPYYREKYYLFVGGLMAGFIVLTEYPTAPVIAFLTLFFFFKLIEKKRILFFIAGGLIFAILMFYYNTVCFDNPFSVGYSTYGTAENPSWSEMKKGVMGIQLPNPKIIYLLLFGTYRGLFYLCPFLLLSIPGFFFLFSLKEKRSIFYLSIVIVLYFLCLNSGYGDSQVFWGGGVGMGPRHLIPMIPFLTIPVLLALKRIKFLGIFLIILSISFMLMAVSVEPRASYSFMNPLVHYYIPNFFRGDMSQNNVTTFLPKFDNMEFVAYNMGEVLGLRRLKSLLPLSLLWLLIAAIFTRYIIPEVEKPNKLFYLKTSLLLIFFITGSLYLNNLFGISDLSKLKGQKGLFGKYYNNKNWQGTPDFTRVDKRIDFVWDANTGRPFPGTFSTEWDGFVLIDGDGQYTFGTNSDDGSMLYIDNTLVVDNGGEHGSRMKTGSIYLTKGYHKIKIEFQDLGGGAVMSLYAQKPGGKIEIIDSEYLRVSIEK
ncbi:hypothetical protein KKB18_01315 [bacterium]|nr:hypothetical protein [bacterium]